METVVGAIVGGLIAYVVSFPIFGMKGGRMVRPGVIEFDPARGDVPPWRVPEIYGQSHFYRPGWVGQGRPGFRIDVSQAVNIPESYV